MTHKHILLYTFVESTDAGLNTSFFSQTFNYDRKWKSSHGPLLFLGTTSPAENGKYFTNFGKYLVYQTPNREDYSVGLYQKF